mmetsp:Transcript_1811/g.3895  ORF Transcript_1811/g.3895 Transcript_1811/m.3895 type:complete len:226 (-) Transcript_1811:27-704(-)
MEARAGPSVRGERPVAQGHGDGPVDAAGDAIAAARVHRAGGAPGRRTGAPHGPGSDLRGDRAPPSDGRRLGLRGHLVLSAGTPGRAGIPPEAERRRGRSGGVRGEAGGLGPGAVPVVPGQRDEQHPGGRRPGGGTIAGGGSREPRLSRGRRSGSVSGKRRRGKHEQQQLPTAGGHCRNQGERLRESLVVAVEAMRSQSKIDGTGKKSPEKRRRTRHTCMHTHINY